MLNVYQGQLQTSIVLPIDVGRTGVRFEWFALEPLPDPAGDERCNELTRFGEEVQAEDAQIREAVQVDIGSRAYTARTVFAQAPERCTALS